MVDNSLDQAVWKVDTLVPLAYSSLHTSSHAEHNSGLTTLDDTVKNHLTDNRRFKYACRMLLEGVKLH